MVSVEDMAFAYIRHVESQIEIHRKERDELQGHITSLTEHMRECQEVLDEGVSKKSVTVKNEDGTEETMTPLPNPFQKIAAQD